MPCDFISATQRELEAKAEMKRLFEEAIKAGIIELYEKEDGSIGVKRWDELPYKAAKWHDVCLLAAVAETGSYEARMALEDMLDREFGGREIDLVAIHAHGH